MARIINDMTRIVSKKRWHELPDRGIIYHGNEKKLNAADGYADKTPALPTNIRKRRTGNG